MKWYKMTEISLKQRLYDILTVGAFILPLVLFVIAILLINFKVVEFNFYALMLTVVGFLFSGIGFFFHCGGDERKVMVGALISTCGFIWLVL
jgi:hypothetical protein